MFNISSSSSSSSSSNEKAPEDPYIETPFDIIGSYFRGRHLEQLARHQIESYNNFVNFQLPRTIEMFNKPDPISSELDYNSVLKKNTLEIFITFENFKLFRPQIHENNGAIKLMFPQEARDRNFTYAGVMTLDINVKYVIRTGKELENVQTLYKVIKDVHIGKLPFMVKSSICLLTQYKHVNERHTGECKFDTGGYFIINGSEKTVLGQERAAENKIYCFNISKSSTKFSWTAEIKSVPDNKCISPKQINLLMSKKNNGYGFPIYVQIPKIKQPIPLFIMFRALGINSDKEICEMILLDIVKESEMLPLLQASIVEANQTMTTEDAVKYITNFAVFPPLDMDRESAYLKKTEFTLDILNNDLFPHCQNVEQRTYFLGYMVNRLLQVVSDRVKQDDRDSYLNKRIDLTGSLLNNLFRNYFNKLVRDMERLLKKEINTGSWRSTDNYLDIITETNIYKIIKPTTIENGIKRALSTGDFSIKHGTSGTNTKVGVAQVLNRLTYVSKLSHLRRISTPIDKSGKLIPPRKLHSTSWGYLCLAGDSNVLLSNRIDSRMIKDVKDGDWVNTVNRESLLDEPSDIYNYFCKMPDKLFQIKTISGRTIKATADHPFLVKVPNGKYEMKKLGELDVANDKLVIRHMVNPVEGSAELKETSRLYGLDGVMPVLHNDYELPGWIVPREYLSGFCSQFGDSITISHGVPQIYLFASVENIGSVIRFTSKIVDMFKSIGIDCSLNSVTGSSLKSKVSIIFTNTIENIVTFADNICFPFHDKKRFLSAGAIEHFKTVLNEQNPERLSIADNGCVCVPIESITEIEPEPVYDFTTRSNNHSFVASSFVLSNCLAETPEGQSVGVVKNLSCLAHVTIQSNSTALYTYVDSFIDKMSKSDMYNAVKIFVNGAWVGVSRRPMDLYLDLKDKKYKGIINIYTAIVFDYKNKEIRICNDAGRITRPVLKVKNKSILVTPDIVQGLRKEQLDWDDLVTSCVLNESIIEYIDPEEQNWTLIATRPSDIKSAENYTHCEIHPSVIFGILASCIPYPDHNQSPRNTYQCAQSKQAMGVYVSNFENRMDKTAYLLNYPMKPLVDTRIMNMIKLHKIPAGTNLIVAIMTHTGYNQEDSILVNQGSIDRGMALVTVFHTERDEDKQKLNGDEEIRCKPDPTKTKGMKMGNYKKVNSRGLIPENTLVENRDVIIAKVVPIKENRNDPTKVIKFEDQSRIYKTVEPTYIDKNYVDRNGDGYNFAKVRLRAVRKPVIGDKFCLTDDHDVLTLNRGWVPITDVQLSDYVAQWDWSVNKIQYVNPLEVLMFDHEGEMAEVHNDFVSQKVTLNHRMWVVTPDEKDFAFHLANNVLDLNLVFLTTTAKNLTSVQYPMAILNKCKDTFRGKVYCLRVPSGVFLVRRLGRCSFTGNSSRHGQVRFVFLLFMTLVFLFYFSFYLYRKELWVILYLNVICLLPLLASDLTSLSILMLFPVA